MLPMWGHDSNQSGFKSGKHLGCGSESVCQVVQIVNDDLTGDQPWAIEEQPW
jgi:hypothetical protein